MMEMLTKEIRKKCVTISICAIKKEETFFNVFTLVRDRLDLESCSWRKKNSGKKIKFFYACFLREEAEKIIEQMTSENSFCLQVGEQSFEIEFGVLKQRTPVFMPNDIGNSVANDWWPGTLSDGFNLYQWFCNETTDTFLHRKTIEDIRDFLGIQIDKLSDLLYGIVRINSIESSFSAKVSYNPDNQNVFFYLKGDIPLAQFRVVLLLHEGEEAIYKKMVDLPSNSHSFFIKSPFNPTNLGYELYQLCKDNTWQLIASKLGTLLRGISIEIGIIQGKLKVINDEKEEDYNVVSNSSPVVVDGSEEDIEQPWIRAELDRNNRNRAIELEEVGSMFMPSDGSDSHKKLMDIIDEKIIKPENKFIYVWDPYLDGDILHYFVVQALRYPSMRVQMILSEGGPSIRGCGKSTKLNYAQEVDLTQFDRCDSLIQEFQQISDGLHVNNLQIRNWYRSGKPVFHDRFIITSHGVWQLGSSLKDIGNYHTTIYKLDGNLPAQVEAEFKRAWEGDFRNIKPSGFQVIPFVAEEKG